MSFDFQLAHACPHLTVEEEVPLAADRMELRTLQPVASSAHIRITANDEVTIPPAGLHSRAQLAGTVSAPFRILKNENEISISNRTTATQDISLPVGTRVPTSEVVRAVRAALRDANTRIQVEDDGAGHLLVTDFADVGRLSRISVHGAAAEALGFTFQTQARGRQVYPPWDFAERDIVRSTPGLESVRTVPTRFPKFREPVRQNPVFKVSYTTYQSECRRCQSFGIENDYLIAASGGPLTVQNEDLLNQGVLKILSTIKRSNPFHPEYGSILLTRIGTKALLGTTATVNEDVIAALSVYQRLQDIQGRFQEITAREKLASVISINTFPSEFDPTVFAVEIVASNASNVPVVITTVFAAPGTAALAGSNGLSLGLEGFGLDPRTRALPGIAVR